MITIPSPTHYASLEHKGQTVCGKLLFEDGRRRTCTVILARITCPRCRELLAPWLERRRR